MLWITCSRKICLIRQCPRIVVKVKLLQVVKSTLYILMMADYVTCNPSHPLITTHTFQHSWQGVERFAVWVFVGSLVLAWSNLLNVMVQPKNLVLNISFDSNYEWDWLIVSACFSSWSSGWRKVMLAWMDMVFLDISVLWPFVGLGLSGQTRWAEWIILAKYVLAFMDRSAGWAQCFWRNEYEPEQIIFAKNILVKIGCVGVFWLAGGRLAWAAPMHSLSQ